MDDADRVASEPALEHLAFAAEAAEQGVVCPFCGRFFDVAVLRRFAETHDYVGLAEYMAELEQAPINEQGDDWGQRARDG